MPATLLHEAQRGSSMNIGHSLVALELRGSTHVGTARLTWLSGTEPVESSAGSREGDARCKVLHEATAAQV